MDTRSVAVGAALLCAGIGTGAFGAHALRSRITPEMLQVWNTAVQYHLTAGVSLVALGAAATAAGSGGSTGGRHQASIPPPSSRAGAGAGMALHSSLIASGAALFSGSLYLLAMGAPRKIGMITPLGGLLMMAGYGAAGYYFATL